ncbi:MAG: MATE family efflux transporter [Firmicutes bacterium]|nr:MATE family efflux transporter [Bacillota bacterium]
MKRKSLDMTQGPVALMLLKFGLPIFLGQLFQHLYNTADSIILGNLVSSLAMEAVGCTSNIIKMMVGFFGGISVGCTVVVARRFGEKDDQKLHESVRGVIFLSLFFGALISVIGVLLTDPLLRLMSTPEEVFPLSSTYLKIYFAGLLGLTMYNALTGILRAVGDSTRPFYLLIFSSLLNIVLDLIFVLVFKRGVDGVAYATVLAQALSALLCFMIIVRTDEPYGFRFREKMPSAEIYKDVLQVGTPNGVQNALNQFANIIMVGYVNGLGSIVLGGWVMFNKINTLLESAMMAMGSAVTTFVGQNAGAKQIERAYKGNRIGSLVAVVICIILPSLLFVFADPLMSIFGKDMAMKEVAVHMLRGVTLTRFVMIPLTTFGGTLRAMKRSMPVTIATLAGLIGMRQLYLFIISKVMYTPLAVAYCLPVGWGFGSLFVMIPYFYYRKKDMQAVKEQAQAEDVAGGDSN